VASSFPIVDVDTIADLRRAQGAGQGAFDREMLVGDRDRVQFAQSRNGDRFARADTPAVRRRTNLARANLWAGQIHEDLQASASHCLCGAQMADHALPVIGAVMRAVDAHGLDPALR
jgi:hypothetical protein